jgi:hypothetical protein
MQILRAAIERLKGSEQQFGDAIRHVARLLPEMQARFPDPSPAPDTDTATARFHMFDEISILLREIAAHSPLMLVLDDLH